MKEVKIYLSDENYGSLMRLVKDVQSMYEHPETEQNILFTVLGLGASQYRAMAVVMCYELGLYTDKSKHKEDYKKSLHEISFPNLAEARERIAQIKTNGDLGPKGVK